MAQLKHYDRGPEVLRSTKSLESIATRSSDGAERRSPRGQFPRPPTQRSTNGVPVFLDQLREALRPGLSTSPEIGEGAIKHGHNLLQRLLRHRDRLCADAGHRGAREFFVSLFRDQHP
jgi:hypothetical protein